MFGVRLVLFECLRVAGEITLNLLQKSWYLFSSSKSDAISSRKAFKKAASQAKLLPLIYVFCEGESEQVYTDFLKKTFSDVAVIKRPSATGVFEEAGDLFQKYKKYKDNAEVTDKIWFFFDVEKKYILKRQNNQQ